MNRCLLLLLLLTLLLGVSGVVQAAPATTPAPTVGPSLELKVADSDGSGNGPLRMIVMLTLLALLPTALLMMTAFTRIVIVLHFLRQALGTPGMPPNQVMLGLALFLTFFVMAPTVDKIHDQAWVPFNQGKLDAMGGLDAASGPLREFMLRNVREQDLGLFVKLAKVPRPEKPQDLPMRVVVPAFVTSELRAGFEIGFLLFLPFLVVDLVVSSVLLSMGMMMLPPATVSLPFKILLFVLVDGWGLLASSLVSGFR